MNQRTGFAVLWSSRLAMLAVGANSTAIMAALPSMRSELGLSSAGVEWAVNAYLIVSAAFIVLGALLGRKDDSPVVWYPDQANWPSAALVACGLEQTTTKARFTGEEMS